MKISVCIPNFNYANYIGITLDSILSQKANNLEILIADNNSNDNSIEVIRNFSDKIPFLKYKKNNVNLGFAGNLDEVGRMATGDMMIMMSSDDVMNNGTLEITNKFIGLLGNNDNYAFSFSANTIDENGNVLNEYIGPQSMSTWLKSDIDIKLSNDMGCDVYKVSGKELLKRSLKRLRSPFVFTATFYPRKVYENVGGYGGGRLINPDKWFHWKVLAEVEFAYYIDIEAFYYRVHTNNQNAQQSKAGYLKFLVDEYRSTIEIDEKMLAGTGLKKDDVAKNFINQDILNDSFHSLKNGNWLFSLRQLLFGMSVYPGITFKNKKTYAQIGLLLLGPIGTGIVKLVAKRN